MPDILTSGEIARSLRGASAARRANSEKLERYVRRSLEEPDYADSIASCDTPAWERAFAHVLVVQDLVRRLDGRAPTGRLLGYTRDDSPSEERERYERALAETELGYVHDPSWTNGGISSHGAELEVDDPAHPSPKPSLRHVALYGAVVQVGGIPEVAWQHSASAYELGISSIQDAMVARLLLGAAMGPQSCDVPTGPTEDQISAANLQRRVRAKLGKLPHHLQAVLELAYVDRRYPNQLVSDFGVGLAPIVWQAMERAGETRIGPSFGTLRSLVADARRDWPTYEGPAKGAMKARVRQVADLVLWTAHLHYQAAAGIEPPSPRRKRRRGPKLVAAGTTGSRRRQLVEVRQSASRAA